MQTLHIAFRRPNVRHPLGAMVIYRLVRTPTQARPKRDRETTAASVDAELIGARCLPRAITFFYFYRPVRCPVLLLSAFWNPYAKHVARCLMHRRRVPGAVQIVVKQCEA